MGDVSASVGACLILPDLPEPGALSQSCSLACCDLPAGAVAVAVTLVTRLPSAQNVVLISIASVMDPSLAPRGKHTLHAYLPATEPWSLWEGALLPCLLNQL